MAALGGGAVLRRVTGLAFRSSPNNYDATFPERGCSFLLSGEMAAAVHFLILLVGRRHPSNGQWFVGPAPLPYR
jgi:hypothetical protein